MYGTREKDMSTVSEFTVHARRSSSYNAISTSYERGRIPKAQLAPDMVFSRHRVALVVLVLLMLPTSLSAFSVAPATTLRSVSLPERARQRGVPHFLQKDDSNLDGVVELAGDADDPPAAAEKNSRSLGAPFLSQGEIDPEALSPDLSDPKQARVIIYIILSLVPVLFLIPLMLGSRDLIPLEVVPPVEL